MGDLTKDFSKEEFECPCCGEAQINEVLLAALQDLRDSVGRPIRVNSGYRCQAYNRRIGGSPGSQHMTGRAADIVIRGLTPLQMAEWADMIPGFRNGGIGIYPAHIHVDVREVKARWWGHYATTKVVAGGKET